MQIAGFDLGLNTFLTGEADHVLFLFQRELENKNLSSKQQGSNIFNSTNMKTGFIDQNLYDYVLKNSLREHEILKEIRETTENQFNIDMQIAPDQGQFMAMLVKMTNTKKAIEIGCFTGYSSTTVALAMSDEGRVITCDVNETYTSLAKEYWQKANVAHKIELRLAPALESLQELATKQAGSFDLAFIDADKENISNYYEHCLTLLKSGGLCLVDNTLWSGQVANPDQQDSATVAIRKFNASLVTDKRIDLSLLTLGDGLTIAIKR